MGAENTTFKNAGGASEKKKHQQGANRKLEEGKIAESFLTKAPRDVQGRSGDKKNNKKTPNVIPEMMRTGNLANLIAKKGRCVSLCAACFDAATSSRIQRLVPASRGTAILLFLTLISNAIISN